MRYYVFFAVLMGKRWVPLCQTVLQIFFVLIWVEDLSWGLHNFFLWISSVKTLNLVLKFLLASKGMKLKSFGIIFAANRHCWLFIFMISSNNFPVKTNWNNIISKKMEIVLKWSIFSLAFAMTNEYYLFHDKRKTWLKFSHPYHPLRPRRASHFMTRHNIS